VAQSSFLRTELICSSEGRDGLSQPPPIPDYAKQGPAPAPRRPLLEVLGGLVLGGAISAVAWIALWNVLHIDNNILPNIVVAAVKLALSNFLIVASERFRFAGIGLLLSIPLGALIFFGACVGHLNLH
jgi:hypothetical protein